MLIQFIIHVLSILTILLLHLNLGQHFLLLLNHLHLILHHFELHLKSFLITRCLLLLLLICATARPFALCRVLLGQIWDPTTIFLLLWHFFHVIFSVLLE